MMYVDAPGTSFCRVLSLTSVLPVPRPTSSLLSGQQRRQQQQQRPYSRSSSTTTTSIFLFVLLLFSALLSPAMSLSLYPFGQSVGDRATERTDDGGSGAVKLGQGFMFYGNKYPQLYVNNNGVISFVQELRGYRPKSFPVEEALIAPYWADVDIDKVGGSVWYRETQNEEDLNRASQDVQSYSSQFRKFRARWVFIATWEKVGFYGASSLGLNKTNTFQCVLVCDGTRSFAIFLYAGLQWTTGSNSQGNSDTGLGGNPAQAGFNAGDRVNYHTLEGAGNASVINLTRTSNICSPGKWIFRVDSPQIAMDSGSLLLAPASGISLGGYGVTITGPCFPSDSPAPSVEGVIVGTGVTFPCARGEGSSENSSRTLHCVMPTVFVTGDLTVSLRRNGVQLNYTGVFSFVNPGLATPSIVRHSPEDWVASERVKVSWRPSSSSLSSSADQSWLTTSLDLAETALLDLMTYREAEGEPRLETETSTAISRPAPNDPIDLELPSLYDATLALVRIRVPYPLINGSYLSYWSDVFPVQWDSSSVSEAWCSRWLTEEQDRGPLPAQGACPCTANQADSDTGRWQKDWLCSSASSALCTFRGSLARHCFVSTLNRSQAVNRLCCYGANRELLNLGEGGGGSMLQRYHLSSQGGAQQQQQGAVVPWFSYLSQEVAPFLHCCHHHHHFSSASAASSSASANASLCRAFSVQRPQLSCQGYKPPAAAQAAGDPHLVTLDGLSYTFNGLGDFVLLQDTSGRVRVHVHAARAPDIDGQLGNATLFTAVAMSVANETQVVEVRREGDGGEVTVLVDHDELDIVSSPTELPGMTLYRNQTGNNTVEFTVVLDTAGISVLVSATSDLLNVMVLVGSLQLKGKLEGLLGNYNGVKDDDLRSRQGQLVPVTANMSDIHYLFGMTWHLPRNESLLYHAEDQETEATLDENAYTPVFMDTILEKDLRNGTAELCQGNKQCEFDYQLTGKESIGQSTKQFSDRFESVVSEIAPVVRCPYIEQLANGNRTLEGQAVGDAVHFACDEGFLLTNSTTLLHCQDSGRWSGAVPDCVVDLHQDKGDILLYIAVGSAFGGFVFVIVCAVLLIWAVRKCRRKYVAKATEAGSEPEEFVMPTFFDPSATPNPVFENPLFLSSLQNLRSDDGRFQIPRPRYVDPNIYTEYF